MLRFDCQPCFVISDDEGTSSGATACALSLDRQRRRVVTADCDPRRSSLSCDALSPVVEHALHFVAREQLADACAIELDTHASHELSPSPR